MATAVFRRVLGWLLRVYEVSGPAPRLVVATPPGQVHEMGALMAAASAAAKGWGVTYLGPDLPVADLLSAVGQAGARAVAISVVYIPDDGDLLGGAARARAGLPERIPLLLGGAAAPEIRAEAEAAGARGRRLLGGLPARCSTGWRPRTPSEPADRSSSCSPAPAATSAAGCAGRSRRAAGGSDAWPGGRSISAPESLPAPKWSPATCWIRTRWRRRSAACTRRTI